MPQAALIVEVDGYADSLDSQVEEIADILTAHGGYDLRIAQSEEERQGIWYGRKSAAGAFSRLAPAFYLVDVTVPRSFLAEALREIGQVLARYDLETGHVFHAGDGNLHPCILCDPKDTAQMERVFAATHEIVAICIAKDGSITGEHGVGIEKRAAHAGHVQRRGAVRHARHQAGLRPRRAAQPRQGAARRPAARHVRGARCRSTAMCWRPRPPRKRPRCWLAARPQERRCASLRLRPIGKSPYTVTPTSCSPRTS